MLNLYYAIVGTTTDTNMGLVRFMGLILLFIVVVGGLFWAIG
jgi:cbb3-type cytochrome oxidase subunit 3